MNEKREALTVDPRIPTEHGVPIVEVIDLGGPVARIERTTYAAAGSRWTRLTIMVPSDYPHDEPGGSIHVSLSPKQLAHFLERLAWPT